MPSAPLNRPNDMNPVTIAGAGPSGLAAAIALARGGRKVVVHEAKRDVGTRFIGDFQIIENASETERVPEFLDRIGIEQTFWTRPATEAAFYDHRGRRRVIRSREPYGYFIRRGSEEGTLDRALLAQALALGVEVRFESRLPLDQADIAATGPASPDGLARETTFPCALPDTIEVDFDHTVAPGGYSYFFVLDGFATFGCAIVADFKKIDTYFAHTLERVKKRHGIEIPAEARNGYSYMNFHLKSRASSERSLYVGEAAGFQDYLFGLGIRYALTTGNLAARSLLENRSFDELWTERLQRKQETSLVNRFLYERGGNPGLSMFVWRASIARDFHHYLSSWHRETWWKRALTPLIKRLWHHDGRCQHKPGRHWCRARETEIRVPALGPIPNDRQ